MIFNISIASSQKLLFIYESWETVKIKLVQRALLAPYVP